MTSFTRHIIGSIDNTDEWGLVNHHTNVGVEYNELRAESIFEAQWERDSVQSEKNIKEIQSNYIYVGRIFIDEEKACHAYNSYALSKGFGMRKGKTWKS